MQTKHIMRNVIYALLPAIAIQCYFFNIAYLIQIALCVSYAVAFEAIALYLRGKNVITALQDCSAILTAMLFALAIPPLTPWWATLIAMFFAIVVAKQLYGGLGCNIFNPAMVAYVVLIISFPKIMALFPDLAHFKLHANAILQHIFALQSSVDAISGATPLDHKKILLYNHQQLLQFNIANLNYFSSIAIAYTLGGLYLCYKSIIKIKIPLLFIAGILIPATILWAIAPQLYLPPLYELILGATIFGAFFIVTDPVTLATSPQGEIIYALGAGFLTYIIRTFASFPDGVAFAILLMNISAPMLDEIFIPKPFGY